VRSGRGDLPTPQVENLLADTPCSSGLTFKITSYATAFRSPWSPWRGVREQDKQRRPRGCRGEPWRLVRQDHADRFAAGRCDVRVAAGASRACTGPDPPGRRLGGPEQGLCGRAVRGRRGTAQWHPPWGCTRDTLADLRQWAATCCHSPPMTHGVATDWCPESQRRIGRDPPAPVSQATFWLAGRIEWSWGHCWKRAADEKSTPR
jgi:hypothetical protein